MLLKLIIAFNLGLVSTLHCVGMCGGVLTSLMLGSKEDNTDKKSKKIKRSFAYNLGRIFSYSFAGLCAGFFGAQFIELTQSSHAHFILQCIAALVLIALALNMLDLFPFSKFTESVGMRLWRFIQPFGKHLYPITSDWRALLFGMLWGWLPCGMVYSAVLLSLTMGSALEGMLLMFFFGLGTLPGMLTTGYFSAYLNRLRSNIQFKWLTATLMLLIAISLPVSTMYFSTHHNHQSSETTIHHH